MAKYQAKAKTQKAYNKNPARETTIPANCVAVFPMLIVSGSTYITEHGTMPQNLTYDKGSFLFWQEVFDGRSSIKIQWDGAITLEKPLEKNYYLAEPKVGKYFFGKPISSGTESLEIGDDQSFDEFITMRANQTVKIRFEFDKSNRLMYDNLKEDLRFVDNDLYKLYLIPEICEGKLMYISDYEEIYEDKSGLSYACEITFQSLGNELQKSGKAVEQYPQWSAPGEFYVKPKIIYSVGNVREKRVIIDPAGLNPNPIKYLQVELQGPALTSCIYALGRKQEKDPETGKWKIGPSKHLLGFQFVSTQPNPLNRTSVPTKNYDCFYDEEVCFATNAEFLSLLTDKISQPLEQMKNGGLISLGHNKNDWESIVNGIHKSNDPEKNNGNRYDYYDETWKPLSYLTGHENPRINTNGCVYATETMEYDIDGDSMIDIMNKNVFTFNQQPVIPLSMYATRPFYLRNIPLVGSIANFFSLGDIHLFSATTNRQTSHLVFFGDADLMALCANLQQGLITEGWRPFGAEGKVAFPINFFGNNETSYNKLGVNSVNTTFCIELTDQIAMTPDDLPASNYDTLWLGQSTKEDGTPFYPDEPDRTLLVNGTMKAIKGFTGGYIIDAVVVQTIFDGKIRISCYSTQDDELLIPEWTTTILSNANWQGGAMRDWTNMYILSNWTDRFCRQQDEFTYPLAPRKQSSEYIILPISAKRTFNSTEFQGWFDNVELKPADGWTQTQLHFEGVDNSIYASRNSFISNYEVSYTDLAIEGVEDRDSFIDYFENIQLDAQQSNVDYQYYDTGSQSERTLYQNIWNEGFRTIGSLVEGVYTYDFECPVVAINNFTGNVWKNHNLSNTDNEYYLLGYFWRQQGSTVLFNYGTGSSLEVKPRVHIELQQSKIVISTYDCSNISISNLSQALTDYENKNITLATNNVDMSRKAQMKYGLYANSIRFDKKGNNSKFSNRRYGVNGTENH